MATAARSWKQSQRIHRRAAQQTERAAIKKGPGIITKALEAICIIDRSYGSRADTGTARKKPATGKTLKPLNR